MKKRDVKVSEPFWAGDAEGLSQPGVANRGLNMLLSGDL